MARKANREMWMKQVENQRNSGLPRKKWCEANNVNFNNLAYWIGRLKKESIISETNETSWAKVVLNDNVINKNVDKLTVTIGKAIIDVSSNTCSESFEKVVQVLVKYV